MSSAICFNLDQSEILSSGNGLMYIIPCHHLGFDSTLGPMCYHCDYFMNTPSECDTMKQCGRAEVSEDNLYITG